MRAYLHRFDLSGQSGGYARPLKSPGLRDGTRCRVPEPSRRRRLTTDASGLDRLVEMVALDAPLLADPARLELPAPDPLAYGLLLDLE
jgi:hypothetical protein